MEWKKRYGWIRVSKEWTIFNRIIAIVYFGRNVDYKREKAGKGFERQWLENTFSNNRSENCYLYTKRFVCVVCFFSGLYNT